MTLGEYVPESPGWSPSPTWALGGCSDSTLTVPDEAPSPELLLGPALCSF